MPLNVALKLPMNHFTWMLPFREILCAVVLTLCTECSTTDCHRLAALFNVTAKPLQSVAAHTPVETRVSVARGHRKADRQPESLRRDFVTLDLAWYTVGHKHYKTLAPCGQCIVARNDRGDQNDRILHRPGSPALLHSRRACTHPRLRRPTDRDHGPDRWHDPGAAGT